MLWPTCRRSLNPILNTPVDIERLGNASNTWFPHTESTIGSLATLTGVRMSACVIWSGRYATMMLRFHDKSGLPTWLSWWPTNLAPLAAATKQTRCKHDGALDGQLQVILHSDLSGKMPRTAHLAECPQITVLFGLTSFCHVTVRNGIECCGPQSDQRGSSDSPAPMPLVVSRNNCVTLFYERQDLRLVGVVARGILARTASAKFRNVGWFR